ncbi:hypothetical protein J2X11_000412 [Aeromicrobium panaciterrae]|uniref:DUF4389 domain-containing protein n=1 Tax=Aeromicrobium panaciterrae TaxID=363861 RepID=A0ABU1UK82_9ACTN|nr:DUF4389 domain-containing protein [Aeromicrobium panaciterrae]MDR7085573.1 hypothetical protein [Aeromicrobium panaciterrae]
MSAETPPPPPPTSSADGSYPATFGFDPPESIARWRVIGNIILAIPHFIVLYVLNFVAELLAFVAWILGVFTGKVPEGILGIIALYIRYSTRVSVYAGFLTEEYPPFTFATTSADPGDYPRVNVGFAPETEGRNRLTIFFRIILAIPHLIVLGLISIVAFFAYVVAFFAVLFTGKWPVGLRNFVVGLLRWSTRLNAYMYLLTDKYPPFSLE